METFRIDLRDSSSKNGNDPYLEFNDCFNEITRAISSLHLTQAQTNTVFGSMTKLARAQSKLFGEVCGTSVSRLKHAESVESYICAKLRKFTTEYRRHLMCLSSEFYVAPIEKAIGLHFRSEFDRHQNAAHHDLHQSYFHYVPVIETLKSLFKNADFKAAYMQNGHLCVPGIYEKFCCAQLFKNSTFFRENPNAIQLRFAIDDFDICAPCKSKAVIHKVTAVYMQIENLPCHLQSKHENIFLVALCKSTETKQKFTTLDNVIEHIVSEVKILEREGVDIGSGKHLKGALVSFTYDNLGGNGLLGFVECFTAKNWCRICELTRDECSCAVAEDVSKIRQIKDYNDQVKAAENSDENNIKGVKKYCILNDLSNFHVLKNVTVDLMHDVLEGVAPYFLSQLFAHIVNRKILKKSDLEDRVRDHNYGALNSDCRPSFLDLSKKSLNQNARQMYCLILNVPFILMDLKNKLEDVWICVRSLLVAIQIIFSQSMNDNDLVQLEKCITTHLKSYIDVFEKPLKPKQHLFLHYPFVIRKSGPVKNMWMMRFESKHKYFTDRAKKTTNFKNITKTLAADHQQNMLNYGNSFRDHFEHSVAKYQLVDTDLMYQITCHNLSIENLFVVDFLKCNGIEYRKRLMITQHKTFYEILYVLKDESNSAFWFLCATYDVKSFDEFSNSFEISLNNSLTDLKLIPLEKLQNKRSYERIFHKESTFIKAETLDLRKENYL